VAEKKAKRSVELHRVLSSNKTHRYFNPNTKLSKLIRNVRKLWKGELHALGLDDCGSIPDRGMFFTTCFIAYPVSYVLHT
jgi:hypothetical protein